MAMSIYEQAKKYYPKNWSIDRLKKLVSLGKLTEEEFKEITGEDYEE
jgi:hypothetical protein